MDAHEEVRFMVVKSSVATATGLNAHKARVTSQAATELSGKFGDAFIPGLDDERVSSALAHFKSGRESIFTADKFGEGWERLDAFELTGDYNKACYRLGNERDGQSLTFNTVGNYEVSLNSAVPLESSGPLISLWNSQTYVLDGKKGSATGTIIVYREIAD